jgi:hypothetical protein
MLNPEDSANASPVAAAPSPNNPQYDTRPSEDAAGDAALIDTFSRELKIPSPLNKWYQAFDQDRKYVNDECMILDAEDAVGTNHILRNQWVLQAQIFAKDPEISFQPIDQIYPDIPPVIDPMSGMTIAPDMPGQPPPEIEGLARTLNILVQQILRENRFSSRLKGAIQDVETNAIMFLKVNQQEDLSRDPLGVRRSNDQQGNYAMFTWLTAKKAAGEIKEGSAQERRLQDLEKLIRGYLAADLRVQIESMPMPGMDPTVAPSMPGMTPPIGSPLSAPSPDMATAVPTGGVGGALSSVPMGLPTMAPIPPPDPRIARAQAIESGVDPIDMGMIPQVPRWIGMGIDIIAPEDIRIDWRITRPEDIFDARRIYHRVFMDDDECAAKYKLDPIEMAKVPRSNGVNQTSGGANTGTGGEAVQQMPDTLADNTDMSCTIECWECWDKQTNTVYVFVPGYRRFLQSYIPDVVGRNWFPFLPFIFNRVTGRLVGISSTTLQRPAQEEINLFRTHDRHAKKASFPRILIKRGLLTKREKHAYKTALPYEVIEVDSPDEISKTLYEARPLAYNPQLYDVSRAEFDLQRMAGISLVSAGATGASESATEVVTAQAGTDSQADFKRSTIEALVADIGSLIGDLAIQIFPEENVKMICGPGAIWPAVDRETLFRKLHLVVRAGSTGKPDAEKRMQYAQMMVAMIPALGLVAKGPALLDELTRDAGLFVNISKFVQLAPTPLPAPMGSTPGGAAPAGAGKPPGSDSGGAPPQDGPPSTVASIPNHPPIPS